MSTDPDAISMITCVEDDRTEATAQLAADPDLARLTETLKRVSRRCDLQAPTLRRITSQAPHLDAVFVFDPCEIEPAGTRTWQRTNETATS